MFRAKMLLHTFSLQLAKTLSQRHLRLLLTFGEEQTTIPTFGSYFFEVVPQKFWNQISDIVRLLCYRKLA